ncbi:DUF4286 family protein [Microvirga aerophila]|uniref:Uncharacterized protein n=1 Tax=Microvirga aerophila TaxID=670291 RepID=A0A512BVY7_9HYPH|nr:DUF4286 family protein [Microvirga aerophila]GEO16113.1 hypothetical protein MAE02_38090 [Microvirga aerophila]
MSGFLAIWSDIDDRNETDYLHWLTREHLQERVGTKGFLSGRVFRALQPDVRRYFILYELASPDVVGSEDYLTRLNNPTPWSQKIMPLLGNFARGGGRVVAEAGPGWGGVVAALPVPDADAFGRDDASAQRLIEKLTSHDRIVSARVLEVNAPATTIPTREKSIRSGDTSFQSLLVVEGLDSTSVEGALASLVDLRGLPENGIALYTAVCALHGMSNG